MPEAIADASGGALAIKDKAASGRQLSSSTANAIADIGDDDYDVKVTKKRQRQLAMKICADLLLFILFLGAFTVVVLTSQNTQSALLVSRVKEFIEAKKQFTATDPGSATGQAALAAAAANTPEAIAERAAAARAERAASDAQNSNSNSNSNSNGNGDDDLAAYTDEESGQDGIRQGTALEDVSSIGGFYDYLENSLFGGLARNSTDRDLARGFTRELLPIDITNRLFGTVKVRQVRVGGETEEANSCIGGFDGGSYTFSKFTTVCKGYYSGSSGNANETDFGPNQMFRYYKAGGADVVTTPGGYGNYASGATTGASGGGGGGGDAAETTGETVTGRFGTYEAGGFMLPVSTNMTQTLQTLRTYKKFNFIDSYTRAVIIDFNVWNSNLNQYAVVQILFEFPPVGKVYTSHTIRVLTPRYLTLFGGSSSADMIANIMDVVLILFVLWYIAEELSEISLEKWGYFEDGWNIVDWTNLALLLTSYMIRMTAYLDVQDLPVGHTGKENELSASKNVYPWAYTNFQGIAGKVETSRVINSLNSVLLWSKCIKYVAFFPYIQFLFYTVKDAMGHFFVFMVMFVVLNIGFVVSFITAFGDVIPQLSTFGSALIYLLRSIVADIDVLPIYESAPVYGAFLILMFYICIILVSLNVFFAIMAATLMETTYAKDREKDAKQEAIVVILNLIYERITNFIRLERRIKMWMPAVHRKIYGSKKKKSRGGGGNLGSDDEDDDGKSSPGGRSSKAGGRSKSGKFGKDALSRSGMSGTFRSGMSETGMSSTTMNSTFTGRETIRQFSPRQVMQAVENMAGRLLSKIHACGIEIRIEVLRVQESLNQMCAIAKALAVRVDKIQSSQDKFLRDFQT